jgi:hypothetical protein
MEKSCCGTCEFAKCPLTCSIAEKVKKELKEQIFPSALKIKSELIYYEDGENCPCWQRRIKK